MAQNLQKVSDRQIRKQAICLTAQQLQKLKVINTMQHIQLQPAIGCLKKQPEEGTDIKIVHIAPPTLDRRGANKRHQNVELEFISDPKQSKTSEKLNKGLKHFSKKVCEKVREKGTTTYNEVAEELVVDFENLAENSTGEQYDHKNIRRRVYDVLKVLVAMNIVAKEKKEISWVGLPSNSFQECADLEAEKEQKMKRISEKRKNVLELMMNFVSFKNLVQRNQENEEILGRPISKSLIKLPFLVVSTNEENVINCSISQDKSKCLFKFNDRFEIRDDLDVLKEIGMTMGLEEGKCSPENLKKIKAFVPEALEEYVVNFPCSN